MVDNADDLELEVEKKEPKKKVMLLVGGIVLIAIIISVAITILLLADDKVGDSTQVNAESRDESIEKSSATRDDAYYYEIRPSFIVNYNAKGRIRYLQVHVELMTRDEDMLEKLQKHLPLIKNNLVTLFSSQEFENIKTYEGKELLRESALEELQQIMFEQTGEPGVEAVLFTSFVLQ